MKHRRILVFAAIAASLLAARPAPAQSDDIPAEVVEALRGRGDAGRRSEELPSLDKVVEGMTKIDGFITLYQDKEKNRLYAVIPGGLAKDPFLMATSITRGRNAGFMWSDMLVKIEKLDRELLFVLPNTFQTASGTLADVVSRTYPDAILGRARILAMAGNNNFVIDLAEFLSSASYNATGMRGSGTVRTVGNAKAFPDNTEVELVFRSVGGGNDFGVHYSMSRLPKTDYKPRVADQRVGYFLTAQEDFSKDEKDTTRFVRYINRWHLKKADPSLEMSPPAEPIVFYVEKTVPIKYRKAVAEGILEWNKAFEKVGIVDAIVVRQQTEDNEFSKLDPEDVRYNFFRWIASGRSFAMGPSRTNPLTGQILDADIIMDEGMVRSYAEDFDIEVDRLFNDTLSLDDRRHYVMNPWEHPDWAGLQREYARVAIERGADAPSLAAFMADHVGLGAMPHRHASCEIGTEMSRQMAFAMMSVEAALTTMLDGGPGTFAQDAGDAGDAADEGNGADTNDEKSDDEKKQDEEKAKKERDAKKKEFEKLREKVREDLIQQMVKSVVMHEVGHTLGLRHNFKASSWKTLEEILKADRNEPLYGSVMEYPAISIPDDFERMGPYNSLTLGPYDFWAIEYGYAIPGQNGQPSKEPELVKAIAGRMADPSLVYATDEDVNSPDPLINRWDLGTDPLEFAAWRMDMAEKVMPQILTRIVRDGDSYDKARRAYQIMLGSYFQAATFATKFIGGHYVTRSHKGDKDAPAPIVVVEATRQRAAMDLIVDRLLKKGAISIDPELQSFLAASRWSHRGSSNWSVELVYPIQDTIMNLHRRVLSGLFSTTRLRDLYDSAYRVAPGTDVFSIPEMMDRLTLAIFAEVISPEAGDYTLQQPMIDDVRRNLQREYVSRLIQTALRDETTTTPPVVRSLAYAELARIKKIIEDGRRAVTADAYTVAHLDEMGRRITKTLDADFTINAGGGGGLGLFSLLFFGQQGEAISERHLHQTPAGVETPRRMR